MDIFKTILFVKRINKENKGFFTFKNNNNLQNFNYAQIKEFNRFYFVDYFLFLWQ